VISSGYDKKTVSNVSQREREHEQKIGTRALCKIFFLRVVGRQYPLTNPKNPPRTKNQERKERVFEKKSDHNEEKENYK